MAAPSDTISVADAVALMNAERFSSAIDVCDQILAQMPDNATAICVRERCRWMRGADADECYARLQQALDLAPGSARVRNYMAEILTSAGRLDESRVLLEQALDLEPDNVQAFLELAEITRFSEQSERVRHMLDLRDSGALDAARMEIVDFALAKVFSDLEDPERAMFHVSAANAAADRQFDVEQLRRNREDFEQFAAQAAPAAQSSGNAAIPIFIVGMPRSGTTLVETILSRHPDVHAGGEMQVIGAVERTVQNWLNQDRKVAAGPYTMLDQVPGDVWSQNAAQVLSFARQRADRDFIRYTDKMPENAKRLPLISRLFPHARIIYVRRHPLDCCLSNLFKRFVHLPYSFRQDWLGRYYRDLTEIVADSRPIVPNPVLDLSYNLLVADPENQVRRLVAFAGLDWHDGFLNPEQAKRSAVMTASRWQVRQPIYKSSSSRWKPYAPWLAELIAAMGGMEWVEAQAEDALNAGRA